MEKIKSLDIEIKQLEKQLKEKKEEIIKEKLKFLSQNEDDIDAHLTREEWKLLQDFLIENKDCTSVKMQYSWYNDIDIPPCTNYDTIIRIGNKYITIHDNLEDSQWYTFRVDERLDIKSIQRGDKEIIIINGVEFTPNVDDGWKGVDQIIGGKGELTKTLDIDRLFEIAKQQESEELSTDDDTIKKIPDSVKEEVKQYTGYSFEEFISQTKNEFQRPRIVMGDGVSMSVQASAFHYCEPRKSGLETYDSYEVSNPSKVIEQLRDYTEFPVESEKELLDSIYPFVPAEVLSEIVMEHGGIDKLATLQPERKLDGYKKEKIGMQAKNEKAHELINQLMAQLGNVLGDYRDDDK